MREERLISVRNDLFSVADRIAAVDDRYRVFYNVGRRKFEVRSAEDGSLQTTIPYDSLDSRAVDHVLKTRMHRIEELLEEIGRENEAAEKRAVREAADKAFSQLKL